MNSTPAQDSSLSPNQLRFLGDHPGASPVEFLLVALGLAAIIAVQLTVVGGWYLLRQWFWVDEWFTWLEAGRPTFHDMWATYDASESNPPLYQIVVWSACQLAGQATEPVLRAVSMASVFSALIGCYLLLRRSFSIDVALAALACLWSLGPVYFHAFDARYYALWLACAIWFAWFVARTLDAGGGSRFGLAICSFALCAVYLLGIVVWGLVMAAALSVDVAFPRRQRLRALMPAGVGPLLAAPFLVWALATHHNAFEAGFWAEPVTAKLALTFLASLLVPAQLAVAAAVGGAALILSRWTRPLRADPSGSRWLLMSFGALPPVLLAVSALGAPLTMERYAFPAVAATLVVAAILLAQVPRAAVVLCAVIWLGQSTLGLKRAVEFNRAVDAQSAALVARVRGLADRGEPVLFESVQQYSILDRYAPDLRDRVQLLDFERSDVRADLSANGGLRERVEVRLFERDLARLASAHLGRPRLIDIGTARANRASAWLILRRDDEPLVWVGGRALSTDGRIAHVEFTP